ncbi:hypothetical protein [Mycolicibacterium goodii]
MSDADHNMANRASVETGVGCRRRASLFVTAAAPLGKFVGAR